MEITLCVNAWDAITRKDHVILHAPPEEKLKPILLVATRVFAHYPLLKWRLKEELRELPDRPPDAFWPYICFTTDKSEEEVRQIIEKSIAEPVKFVSLPSHQPSFR